MLNFAAEMKKNIFFALATLFCVSGLNAQQYYNTTYSNYNTEQLEFQSPTLPPLHEVRAVWLTTIGGLDWPHSYAHDGLGIQRQQQELCKILDQLQHAGINLVLLQTRVRATTIFPSSMEPWDGCLSGKPGQGPGYDGLAFAVEECHKRGMQIHAWVVTLPVGKWNGAGCANLRRNYPHLLRKIGEDGYMNPEMPGTADYLARFCGDIARRYDVDGIHLDYIRYPETWGKIADHNKGRQNITNIVKAIHSAVKAEKPWIMMSCSPIGKYADLPRQWSHGWNARDIVCQDAAMWMQTGLMDAIFPMMYFRNNDFFPFAIDWKERSAGRIVAPGLGIYFLSPSEKNWNLKDITRELHVCRQYGMGHTYFRSKFFTDNVKGIYNYSSGIFCQYRSLIPAMKWYGFRAPLPPNGIQLNESNANTTMLAWNPGLDNSNGNYLTYNVYTSPSYPVNTSDPRNILAVGLRNTFTQVPSNQYYAVTAVDRYGNESQPIQMTPPAGWQPRYGSQGIDNNMERGMHDSNGRSSSHRTNGLCMIQEASNILDLTKVSTPFNLNARDAVLAIETIQGKIVDTYAISAHIDISNLPEGMYVVRTLHKKGVTHRICYLKVKR